MPFGELSTPLGRKMKGVEARVVHHLERTATVWSRPTSGSLHRRAVSSFLNLVSPRPVKRSVTLKQTLAHPREMVYSVVADVESYTNFIPFCRTSRIMQRHADGTFDAKLSLGFLAFSEDYVSRVRLTPPSAIVASASNTPLFERLDTSWRFVDGSVPGTCDAYFELSMLLRSVVHDQALTRVIDRVAAEQVAAFTRRCDELAHKSAQASAAASSSPPTQAPPHASTPLRTSTSPPSSTQPPPPSTPSTPPTRPSAAAAPPPLGSALAAGPAWRQRVDAAFDAHAVDGSLSLGRFVEACRHLGDVVGEPASVDEPVSEVLLAAWYVEFDDDASGTIEREEFSRNLWLLTQASEEERLGHAFRKLDHNGSGALEREDLARSMRGQLALARRLVPLLVRQQVRKEAAAAALGADGAAALAARECQAEGVAEQASAVAAAAIDELDEQVERLVAEVFDSFGAADAIELGAWRDSWRRAVDSDSGAKPTALMGIDGVLGLLGQHDLDVDAAREELAETP